MFLTMFISKLFTIICFQLLESKLPFIPFCIFSHALFCLSDHFQPMNHPLSYSKVAVRQSCSSFILLQFIYHIGPISFSNFSIQFSYFNISSKMSSAKTFVTTVNGKMAEFDVEKQKAQSLSIFYDRFS